MTFISRINWSEVESCRSRPVCRPLWWPNRHRKMTGMSHRRRRGRIIRRWRSWKKHVKQEQCRPCKMKTESKSCCDNGKSSLTKKEDLLFFSQCVRYHKPWLVKKESVGPEEIVEISQYANYTFAIFYVFF